jgi:hypothetical protein
MGTYSIEEKQILLDTMDNYIDESEHIKQILTGEDKDKFVQKLWKIQDLRIKLILDIAPINIKPTDDLDRSERPCILCGVFDNPGVIEWAYVDNKPICQLCFKKYKPEAYEKARKLNHQYYVKEYPDQFNSDGTFKTGEVASVKDDMPW